MLETLRELLAGARRAAIVTHRRADADALACAEVLKLVLERLGVGVIAVVCPEGSLLGGCSEDLPRDVDVYVLADVASLSQVPPLPGRAIRVDHHYAGDDIPGVVVNRPSCTEVALALAEEVGVEIPPDVAKLAVLGIYTDTGGLRRADARTLRALSKLLERLNATLGDVVKEGGETWNMSKTMAFLKGFRRLEVYSSSVGLICATHVGAYESDVASLLVSVGCRVAVVASRKEDGLRIVFRSRNFDVASIARRIGQGGGHREAAVAVLKRRVPKSELPSILRAVVKEIAPDAKLVE